MGTMAIAYNAWRRVSGDLRGDRREKQIDTGYANAMHNLQEEVRRLSEALGSLSLAFSREQSARREAEELAIRAERKAERLTDRVATLEGELAALRGAVGK